MRDIHLFIDDERPFPEHLFTDLARTSRAAIDFLEKAKADGERVATIAFDHDMGYTDEFDTTRPVLEWMIENEYWPVQMFFHSMNPSANSWMYNRAKDCAPSDVYMEITNAKYYWEGD